MKKSLFLGAVVALTAVLVGCNPKPVDVDGDGGYTSISFKQSEMTIVAGDTVSVFLLYQPTTAARPNATWSSSDTAIVKVIGNGIVVAKDTTGTATVTAKVGELTATCEVTVDYYENLFDISYILYFPASKVAISDTIDTTIVFSSGLKDTIKVQLCSVELFMPNSREFDEEANFLGEGEAVFATASLYFVADPSLGENDGLQYSDRRVEIVNDSASLNKEYAGLAGSFDPAIIGPVFDAYLKGEDLDEKTYLTGAKGAYIGYASVASDGVRVSYLYDGIITDGYIAFVYDNTTGKVTGLDYDFKAKWLYQFYGLAIDWETSMEEGTYVLKKPYEAAYSEEYHYTSSKVNAAPRFVGAKKGMNKEAGQKIFKGKVEKLRSFNVAAL